jgi:GNAT superfamily N-acetyltransferase
MADKKIRVRRAEPKDVVNICKLLQSGWRTQTVEYAPIDDLRGYRWILYILETGMVAVADLNGRVVGAAGVCPYQPAWSHTWLLDLEFLYVMESFRKEDIAHRLKSAVEGFADRHKLSLTFTIQSGDRPAVKDRMMTIAGWIYAGGNFLRAAKKEHGEGQDQDRDSSEPDK